MFDRGDCVSQKGHLELPLVRLELREEIVAYQVAQPPVLPNRDHGGTGDDSRQFDLKTPTHGIKLTRSGIEGDIAGREVGACLGASGLLDGIEQSSAVQSVSTEHHVTDETNPTQRLRPPHLGASIRRCNGRSSGCCCLGPAPHVRARTVASGLRGDNACGSHLSADHLRIRRKDAYGLLYSMTVAWLASIRQPIR